ncbi:hypothetical protein Glove_154g28 [Diversispora epigaea]|uniref:Uncharacterized protein n=1 Tax=Diversispora epigaea TaxID=1348612 RepID=A0A397ISG5_9GLOM|nr:hypothetical protein Glove_154g28 [Diversispora epigaea]
MMKSVGCINITPYKKQKSKPEFWTYNVNFNNDNYILSYLFDMNLLDGIDNKETDLKIENQQLKKTIDKFWKSFDESIKINKCRMDGKQRILSIIAEKFRYKEIQDKLQISNTLISDAKKYGRTNGPGCPNNVSMSSYQVDSKTNLPILYLKNNKETLWHKFEATYPDGIKRTYFMARLANGRYKYQQDLGGLCNICNEYGYETFDILISLLHLNIERELQYTLISELEILPHHLKRGFENELTINIDGTISHVDTINHSKFLELDNNGAVLVCDYKMRILPKNAWFTASSFDTVFNILDPKPKWVRIFSDNGAKSSVDSYHAQINDGKKIETAIKNISGTSVAHLEPKRNHISVKTLPGITKLFYFEWPINGSHAGNILARELSNVGEWKRYTPSDILKLTEEPLHKPTPEVSEYTKSNSEWNYPLV